MLKGEKRYNRWLYLMMGFFIAIFVIETIIVTKYFFHKHECEEEQLILEEKTTQLYEKYGQQ
jgi:hypothetical protein